MAVAEKIQGVKVVLKLEKGSQTISGCKHDATGEALYQVGSAIASLQAYSIKNMQKVVQTEITNEDEAN